MKMLRNSAAIAAALQVAACGGGGGGGGGPATPLPPSPPPPSGTNTSLLNLTASEDFTNVAATGAASYQTSGARTVSGSLTPATIHYDAGNKRYTISTGGRSQTFGPGDLSAADSSAAAAVYIKTNGSTTDSLTLTKPGTSGRFTYEYVGGAYWQRTTTGTSSFSGSLDALAYGVETPDAALPRTGRAEYAIDLLGVATDGPSVNGISGQGMTQVDFARGLVVTHGSLAPENGGGDFSSEARISSTANSFAGNFRLDLFDVFAGELQGQFFGPQAQEIGGAFYAKTASQRVAAGTILGRGAAVSGANASVKTPTVSEFFAGDATRLTARLPGQSSGYNSTGAGFTSSASQNDSVIVNYDAATGKYTVVAPDRSQYFNGRTDYGVVTEHLNNTTPQNELGGYAYPTFANLQYVATKEWFRQDGYDYTIEPLVYGIQTSAAAMPRTGRGDYTIGLSGTAADGDYINLVKLTGFGSLNADFAAGTLTLDGQVEYLEDYIIAGVRPRGQAAGTFSGSGTISSSSNSFAGTINLTGLGAYSGAMNGRFFGPTGGEVGGAFQASDGAGGHLVGAFAGGADAAAASAETTLATLAQRTSLPFSYNHNALYGAPGQLEFAEIVYDPQAGSYTLKLTDQQVAGAPIHTLILNSASRDAAASDASYDVHRVTLNGAPYIASILKALPSNPTFSLRYTSLAQLVGTTPTGPGLPSDRFDIAFGLPTAATRMPVSGNATYNGVAVGSGSVRTGAYPGDPLLSVSTYYDLTGTTSMSVNFAAGTFNSTLDLTGTDIASNGTYVFPTFTFNGAINNGNNFGMYSVEATYLGKFFGPNAEEVGGMFEIQKSDAGKLYELKGAFAGKRAP